MRNILKLLSQIASLVVAILIVAATPTKASASIDVLEVYPATYEACSKMPAESLIVRGPKWDEYYAGKFPSGRMNTLLMKLFRESYAMGVSDFRLQDQTPETYGFTHSRDFLAALEKCYPGNDRAKKEFIHLVKHRDTVGKIMAAGTHVGLAVASAFAVGRIAKFGGYLAKTVKVGLTGLTALWMLGIYKSRQEALNQCREQTGATEMGECLKASIQVFDDYNKQNPTFKFDQNDMRKYIELEINDLKLERSVTKDPAKIHQIDGLIAGQLEILATWQR